CKDTGIVFGDMESRTPSSNYSYRDPVAWWDCYDRTVYPSYCTVSDLKPICIDFGSAKRCNILKLDIMSLPTSRINALKIQYSSDNKNWADVTNLSKVGQVWTFTEVSAR